MEHPLDISATTNRRADRIFYSAIPFVAAVIVFIGFSRTWFLRPFSTVPIHPPLYPLLIVHGLVFTAWILLVIVQPLLIAGGNRRLHRLLGYVGAGLAPAMVLLVIVASIWSARRGEISTFPTVGFFLSVNFLSALDFAVAIALAIRYRHHAETHKRLILLALVPLLPPAIGRAPHILGPIPLLECDFIILAGIIFDKLTRGRIHNVWKWGGALIVLSEVLMIVVGLSKPWQTVANWIVHITPST